MSAMESKMDEMLLILHQAQGSCKPMPSPWDVFWKVLKHILLLGTLMSSGSPKAFASRTKQRESSVRPIAILPEPLTSRGGFGIRGTSPIN